MSRIDVVAFLGLVLLEAVLAPALLCCQEHAGQTIKKTTGGEQCCSVRSSVQKNVQGGVQRCQDGVVF